MGGGGGLDPSDPLSRTVHGKGGMQTHGRRWEVTSQMLHKLHTDLSIFHTYAKMCLPIVFNGNTYLSSLSNQALNNRW